MPKSRNFHSNYGVFDYTTEESTKSALQQLAIFYIYLITLTIVGSSLTTMNTYNYSEGMRKLFARTQYSTNSTVISLEEVITIPDFWNYMEHVVLHLFHGMVYDRTSEWEPHMVNNRPNLVGRIFINESFLLGPPRLRQIRVKHNTCALYYAFVRYFNTCMAPYSSDTEFKEPTYKGTTFYTMSELEASPIYGHVNKYSSGGYVQMLSYIGDVNRGIVRHLKDIIWLDPASRLVLFEFNMINLNLDLYQSVKLIFEILPTGLINVKYDSKVLYTDPMFVTSRWIILLCTISVYLINFYFTYVEIKKLYLDGPQYYFSKISQFYTLLRILIIYMSLVYTVYFFLKAKVLDADINDEKDDFVSLDHLGFLYTVHRVGIGILVFLSWISLLRFMDFNPVLRTISLALHMALADLGAFSIMFLILFTAYGNLGFLLFGSHSEDFKDFPTSFITMVRLIISDFNYFKLEAEFPVLAPIFFLTYVMLIFFVLLNMFLAVIVLAFRTATSTIAFKPNFLWYYIRKQLYRISNGLIKAPKYPEWYAGISVNKPLDATKLQELRVAIDLTETEDDLHIFLTRLDMIENIFYRLTNDIEDIIAKSKKQN